MRCKEKNLDCKQHKLSSNICSWYLATMYIFCRKEYLNLQKMHVSFKCKDYSVGIYLTQCDVI